MRGRWLWSCLVVLASCQPDYKDGDEGETGEDSDDGASSGGGSGWTGGDTDSDTDSGAWSTVLINEFMPSNQSTITDESGAYPDWIELYNPGSRDVDLGGWFMSDDLEKPDKSVLSDELSIPAGGFLLLWADSDEDDGPTHLEFNLNAEGEDIGLWAPDGSAIDLVNFGAMAADLAVARVPDGSDNWVIVESPTPGTSNGGSR